ncbi:MAG: hypothetical protein FXF47_08505 [Candidatus Mcinerneyibacterium aminivorans]|uniref:Uncharacterized protein n=1 Tax=Candidatus Mcinerneyibacterium aminivorans TaxID=2703815 RepID=A0A5D0MC80_9BACT|nr:MAG: hypothetical protein FXF47_08505 [Candidatus Mcinerneyibacterium aminivorans]
MKKNKNYYEEQIDKIKKTYGIESKLFYGNSLFSFLDIKHVWDEFLDYLKKWKVSLPALPNLNFDKECDEIFDKIINNLTNYRIKQFFENNKIRKNIIPILFPENLVLEKLKKYYKRNIKKGTKYKKIYNLISETIDERNKRIANTENKVASENFYKKD